ncbi:hypothetical protein BGW38_005336 [Lunasporangiospora selenospora]|uniref:Uncharacterized protein n=1 Tax=Lunasporangiospora selenospora TaxID=979761 RepID=A0A9P6KBK6_9FUNG|nr:hypothetical protein BGW38_005336 [Lunasporangiospora selenospora]
MPPGPQPIVTEVEAMTPMDQLPPPLYTFSGPVPSSTRPDEVTMSISGNTLPTKDLPPTPTEQGPRATSSSNAQAQSSLAGSSPSSPPTTLTPTRNTWTSLFSFAFGLGSPSSNVSDSGDTGSEQKQEAPWNPQELDPPLPLSIMSVMDKDQQIALAASLRSAEQAYKTTIAQAQDRMKARSRESQRVFDEGKVKIKVKKDEADRVVKADLQAAKDAAAEAQIHEVLELVKHAILDLKEQQILGQEEEEEEKQRRARREEEEEEERQKQMRREEEAKKKEETCNGSLSQEILSNPWSSDTSTSQLHSRPAMTRTGTSTTVIVSKPKEEDPGIKEWVEYAAQTLQPRIPKAQARQLLLEAIATEATRRQIDLGSTSGPSTVTA